MSKILNQYNELKKKAVNIVYLFQVGIFYIAINEDAKLLNELLGLKITNLGVSMYKVGFPIGNRNKYENLLKAKNINYKFIENLPKETTSTDYLKNIELKKILTKIKELDLNNTTMVQLFNFVSDIQTKIKNIK